MLPLPRMDADPGRYRLRCRAESDRVRYRRTLVTSHVERSTSDQRPQTMLQCRLIKRTAHRLTATLCTVQISTSSSRKEQERERHGRFGRARPSQGCVRRHISPFGSFPKPSSPIFFFLFLRSGPAMCNCPIIASPNCSSTTD